MIAIVTKTQDATADYVMAHMTRRGIGYIRLDSDMFGANPFRFCFGHTFIPDALMLAKNNIMRVEDIRCVWLRRMVKPIAAVEITDLSAKAFAEQELDFSFRWFLGALSCPVIDPEQNLLVARNKFDQLNFAQQIGLSVPPTLVTNDPGIARQFIETYGDAVVKSIAGYGRRLSNGFEATYTQRVTPEIVQKFDALRFAPVCVQAYVEKDFELRVTIVGECIFACRIDSQISDQTRVDWRRYDPAVPHQPYVLDSQTERKLLAMMNHYRIHFAAFDLVMTPRGETVFLEMNPSGQFVWIEEKTGMPITDTLIDFLIDRCR